MKPGPKLLIQALVISLASLALAFMLRAYVAEAFVVSGRSMEPALHDGDRLLIYKLSSIDRGDIIVLWAPELDRALIKRVVGLPNETVVVVGRYIFINGKRLEEPYAQSYTLPGEKFIQITCGPNEYAVMGDNRPNSHDSRDFGPINKELIIGEKILSW